MEDSVIQSHKKALDSVCNSITMTITASNGNASNTVFRNTNTRFSNFVKSLEDSFHDFLTPHLRAGSALDFISPPNYSTARLWI